MKTSYQMRDGYMVSTMGGQTEITLRMDPCSCGCQGQDPWHQRTYFRVIKDVQAASGQVYTKAFGSREIVAEGKAQLPWGETRVVLVPAGDCELA